MMLVYYTSVVLSKKKLRFKVYKKNQSNRTETIWNASKMNEKLLSRKFSIRKSINILLQCLKMFDKNDR